RWFHMPELRDRTAARRRGGGQAFPGSSRAAVEGAPGALAEGKGERAVGPGRERPGRHHRVDVQRAVDVREGQLRAGHVLVADLGAQQRGVDDEQHQAARHVPVEFVRRPGHLGGLRRVDEALLREGLVHRGARVLALGARPLPVGTPGDVVDEAAHAGQVTIVWLVVAHQAGGVAGPANHSVNQYVSLREERYCLWASPHRTWPNSTPGRTWVHPRGRNWVVNGFAAA